ncbi:MAG: uracil-DNA glycosylase family protein [Verrucomicrobiia bacterium]
MKETLQQLIERVKKCNLCKDKLPYPPKPVFRVSSTAVLLIVGQAPGIRVHNTEIPWNDPSGDRLRQWLLLDREQFYDVSKIAIIPSGLCYPGKAERGDLPPLPECAPQWHPEFRKHLKKLKLTLLVGSHAQNYYLKGRQKGNMAETVRSFKEYLPEFFPLPHPSPRNIMWFKKNQWFEQEILPELRKIVSAVLSNSH